MTYSPRISVDDDYLRRLGRAFYNYTYLEWGVLCLIAKLSADGFAGVPTGKPASKIASALLDAIDTTSPLLSASLRKDLLAIHGEFWSALRKRNRLLHAHPYTADAEGTQRIGGGGVAWSPDEVDSAAQSFEELALRVNDIFHGSLTAERP